MPDPMLCPRRVGWGAVTCQAAANLGFYAVIPFLAAHLSGLGMGVGAVGLILGLRTAAQQGMFLVGGALVDRCGPRALAVLGAVVRVLGFGLLGLGTSPAVIVVAAVLTGLGGALFSPALETTLSAVGDRDATRGLWFARFAAVGELGALIGPVIGGAALGLSFTRVCLLCSALFLLLGTGMAVLLPTRLPMTTPAEVSRASWRLVLADGRFVGFAGLFGVQLLAWNQLYFGFALEAAHAGQGTLGPAALTALMFALASGTVVVLQLPVSRALAPLPLHAVLPLGFALMAAGLLAVPTGRLLGAPPAVGLLVGAAALVLGHMVAAPSAQAAVPSFAGTRPRGAYHGLLSTCGGAAVLLGNLALSPLLAPARPGAAVPAAGWITAAVVVVAAAAGLFLVLRRLPTPAAAGGSPVPASGAPGAPTERTLR